MQATQTPFQLRSFAAYDCGSYGADDYNTSACATTDDGLAYTGAPLYAFAAIATVLIITSVVVLIRRRGK